MLTDMMQAEMAEFQNKVSPTAVKKKKRTEQLTEQQVSLLHRRHNLQTSSVAAWGREETFSAEVSLKMNRTDQRRI